jgi:hypothetical protein
MKAKIKLPDVGEIEFQYRIFKSKEGPHNDKFLVLIGDIFYYSCGYSFLEAKYRKSGRFNWETRKWQQDRKYTPVISQEYSIRPKKNDVLLWLEFILMDFFKETNNNIKWSKLKLEHESN